MKKILLIAILILSISVQVYGNISDVTESEINGQRITEFESYSDYSDISGRAIEYAVYAREMGIMKGVSDTEFSPKTHFTREQAAVTFVRLYNVWVHP